MNSKRSGKPSRRSRDYPRNSGQQPEPLREDWDFSDCPDEELFRCWIYEYSREIPEFINSIEEWRQRSTARTFESFRVLPGRPSVCSPIDTYHCFPEWPSRPYLSITPTERNNRYKRSYPKSSDEYKGHALEPDLPNTFDWELLMDKLRGNYDDGRMPDSLSMLVPGLPHTAILALLQIDLTLPNETLIKYFRSLLKIYRQQLNVRDRPRPTGRGSRIGTLKTDLKALGAYRLRENYKMSASDIISYTKVGTGKALYSDEAHLVRALKRAKQRINILGGELLEF